MGRSSRLSPSSTSLAAGFWEQAGGQFSPGVASLQVDSDTDSKVKDPNNGILNSKFWNAFANSKPPQGYQNTCHAVFGSSSNPLFILRSGISNPKFPKYDPTMQNLQKMLRLLRFYNAADPAVARYQVWQTLTRNPGISDALRGMALPKYLTTVHSIAATLDLGNPGPILLGPDVLTSDALTLKATLVHEVFLHGYAGWRTPKLCLIQPRASISFKWPSSQLQRKYRYIGLDGHGLQLFAERRVSRGGKLGKITMKPILFALISLLAGFLGGILGRVRLGPARIPPSRQLSVRGSLSLWMRPVGQFLLGIDQDHQAVLAFGWYVPGMSDRSPQAPQALLAT